MRHLAWCLAIITIAACSSPPAPVIERSGSSAPAILEKGGQYRVRKGDSLHAISKKFGISISELKRINRLKKSRIYAGQLLKVKQNQG